MGDQKPTIESFLDPDVPTLIDFRADWCRPCKAMDPIVQKIEMEFGTKIKVVTIDVDQEPEIASSLGIMSLPTFSIYDRGQEVTRRIGAMSEDALRAMISDALLDASI